MIHDGDHQSVRSLMRTSDIWQRCSLAAAILNSPMSRIICVVKNTGDSLARLHVRQAQLIATTIGTKYATKYKYKNKEKNKRWTRLLFSKQDFPFLFLFIINLNIVRHAFSIYGFCLVLHRILHKYHAFPNRRFNAFKHASLCVRDKEKKDGDRTSVWNDWN